LFLTSFLFRRFLLPLLANLLCKLLKTKLLNLAKALQLNKK